MTNKVVVLGSLNVDSILEIKRLPKPGETLSMLGKSSAPGGKGANQAVAAARSAAQTSFIGKIGADSQGKMMLASLETEKIDTSSVITDDESGTGSATILLDENGQNSILVYGGANQEIDQRQVREAEKQIAAADFLITQFETPQLASVEAFKIAKENNVTTILNPAPASSIDPELLKYTDLIVPNETESASITGIEITDEESMVASAKAFAKLGVKYLIITVGSKGAFFATPTQHQFIPAFKVKAVDTTAAGDTFIGSLSSQLKPDLSNLAQAITYAQKASSLAVQRLGAMPSIPTATEINASLKQ